MKKLKYISMAGMAVLLLSSCGMLNNHAFLKQKYTNFSHSSSRIEKKEVATVAAITEEQKVVSTHQEPVVVPVQVLERKEKSVMAECTIGKKEQKNQKAKQTAAFVKNETVIAAAPEKNIEPSAETAIIADQNSTASPKSMWQMMLERIVLIICAIILPPVAVYFAESSFNIHFWIDVLLYVGVIVAMGFILTGNLLVYGHLAAMIYALLIVFEVI